MKLRQRERLSAPRCLGCGLGADCAKEATEKPEDFRTGETGCHLSFTFFHPTSFTPRSDQSGLFFARSKMECAVNSATRVWSAGENFNDMRHACEKVAGFPVSAKHRVAGALFSLSVYRLSTESSVLKACVAAGSFRRLLVHASSTERQSMPVIDIVVVFWSLASGLMLVQSMTIEAVASLQ